MCDILSSSRETVDQKLMQINHLQDERESESATFIDNLKFSRCKKRALSSKKINVVYVKCPSDTIVQSSK